MKKKGKVESKPVIKVKKTSSTKAFSALNIPDRVVVTLDWDTVHGVVVIHVKPKKVSADVIKIMMVRVLEGIEPLCLLDKKLEGKPVPSYIR